MRSGAAKPEMTAVEPLGPHEAEKLLDALDEMQSAFAKHFAHNEQYLNTHHWDLCKEFWRRRNDDKPIAKYTAIDWLMKSGVGENRARSHIDKMVEDNLLEEYLAPRINKRMKFVRSRDPLIVAVDEILRIGVIAVKKRLC